MARPTRAARRYAEAAFELATRDKAHAAWHDGLGFAAAVLGDPRIVRAASDPGQPFAERRKLVDRLLEKHVSPPVANLVHLLAQRGRLEMLPLIAAEFQRLLNRERGIVAATVTSARSIDGAETESLRARIRTMTGADVDLTSVVDPELIGGLTVRVGDILLDASVRGRLERLREQLVAGVR